MLIERCHVVAGATAPAWYCNGRGNRQDQGRLSPGRRSCLVVVTGIDDFLATVETVSGNVVATMCLT